MHLILKNVTNFLSAFAKILKHIKIGNNGSSTTKEVLPKDDTVSDPRSTDNNGDNITGL